MGNNDNGEKSTLGPVLEDYWNRQGLQDCLLKCLGGGVGCASEEKGQHMLGLPSLAIDVHVHEEKPPFSKVRVTYQSPYHALQMALYCRQQSLSLAQLIMAANDDSRHKNEKETTTAMDASP